MIKKIERTIIDSSKDRFRFFISIALGFFLGMRYNAYFTDILQTYLPLEQSGSILIRGLILLGVTYAVVALELGLSKTFNLKRKR